MKLRNVLFYFVVLATVISSASADTEGRQVALETTPIGARTVPLLINSVNTTVSQPRLSPSQLLGGELSKMFKEGATKLDPPRAKGLDEEAIAGGAVPTGGRTLRVQAYSYCLSGRTASGRATAHGVVAVDTRVIPMGSKLFIPGYGWAVAADTGGAIVGNKIDVWFPSLGQCYQWGVRPVTIQVFPK